MGRVAPGDVDQDAARKTVAAARGAIVRCYGRLETQSPLLDALLADMDRADGQRTAYESAAREIGIDPSPALILPTAKTPGEP